MPALSWTTPKGHIKRQLEGETHIGRSSKNDIQLLDPSVSSFHARIVCENGTWILKDNNSTNGSFVKGDRKKRSPLKDGDEICLGYFPLTFHASPSAVGSETMGKGAPSLAALLGSRDECPGGGAVGSTIFRDDPNITMVEAIKAVTETPPESQAAQDPRALAQRLKASSEISKSTAGTLDLSEILDRVLGALFEIFETAERSFILLMDPQTQEAKTAAVKRRTSDADSEITISQTALNQAVEKREAVLCMDAMADTRYAGAQSIIGVGIRSMMIAPLVYEDHVLGAIHVDTRHAAGQFTQADLELLSVAAAQVAARVANVQLHEKVVASERLAAVGQTVAGLTHCIKNILQGTQGGAFILDRALRDGEMERVKSGWEMVKRNNSFMEELVFDLLSYSKQRPPEYEATDLNALCEDVYGFAAARAEIKGVSATFTPDPALASLEIDPKGVRRCVLNLLMNAVDACKDSGGSVTLETRAADEDGLVRILVRDTGCGMSAEIQAKLFTVFFSTKGSKGTGLGLPVSMKIVEEHGGRIEVASQEGEGTTFTICLPSTRDRNERKGVRDGN